MSKPERQKIRCVIGAETARMLELGHPWVIADRYTAKWPKAPAGSLAELVDGGGRHYGTALLDPAARIVARLLDAGRVALDRNFLVGRLNQAVAVRRWLELGDSTAWRLVNAEGDGLPGLTVDRYGDYLQVQYYTRAWEPHLEALAEALRQVWAPRGIYVKERPQETRQLAERKGQAPRGRLLAGTAAPASLTVSEHGLRYRVDLERDLHTGLFLDQRDNRLAFRRLVAGQRVLNLFAYTGAFSVAAAAGGACAVTSVDAAARYLDWARVNFRLNGIDPEPHAFLAGDCFVELDRLGQAGRRFDVVLMDPPSFSTTRSSRFTTSGGTADLVTRALALLEPGGLLICSSNHQKIDLADYLKELRKGSLAAGRSLQVIATAGQSGDFPYPVTFPEGRYLKYVVCVTP